MSYFIRLNLVGVGFIYQQLLEMILMDSLLIGRDDKFFVGLGYCQGIVKCICMAFNVNFTFTISDRN